MFDRLPHELALLILEHAVMLLLVSDRTALVHLAQTSKAVYDIVAPQMYRSICIPNDRSRALLDFADVDSPTHALAKRVFQYARSLCTIDFNRSDTYGEIFQQLELIESHVEVIEVIANACEERRAIDQGIETTLRSVHLCWDCCENISRIPKYTRAHITHLCGYMVDPEFCDSWQAFLEGPSAWMNTLLGEVPALTHLGLNLYCDIGESKSKFVERFDLEAFQKTLGTALATGDGRLRVIAVRVAGQHVTRWDQILLTLKRVDTAEGGSSGRIRVWRDDRVPSQKWEECIMSDAVAGRSIWTESLPVASCHF